MEGCEALSFAAFLIAPALFAGPAVRDPIVVRPGRAVTVDGRFAAGEWADAAALPLAPEITLLGKRHGDDLLLAIRLASGDHRYLDLYVADATGRTINLHASMKQGERLLPPGWSDRDPAFTWGPLPAWETNTVAGNPGSLDPAARFKPYDGFELRVPVAHLGQGPWRMRIEVRDFMGARPDVVLPSTSSRTDTASWLPLSLD